MPVLAIILLFGIILGSIWWKIIEKSLNIMLLSKSDFQQKKRPLPGCLQTVVRSGDAPKPPFPIKTNKKSKKSGNQPQINHRNYPLFLSLLWNFNDCWLCEVLQFQFGLRLLIRPTLLRQFLKVQVMEAYYTSMTLTRIFGSIPIGFNRFSMKMTWKWLGIDGKGYANTTYISDLHPHIPKPWFRNMFFDF